jgi:hypothetical protein
MPAGLQEILALLIVLGVVAFALYRRGRKAGTTSTSCGDGCDAVAKKDSNEATVHFYRKNPDQ